MDEWTWLGHGGGEVARHMRDSVDWANTPVGPVGSWSPALKTTIATMLHARHPMFLWWGPEHTQFYNDGYVPSFGQGRHPNALGQRGKECWAEIWPVICPEIEGVLYRGDSTYHEDALVPIFRNGRMEEVYWTYGYSPVLELDGATAGVLVTVTETTSRVLARRRLHAAAALAEAVLNVKTLDELVRSAARALADSPADVPWVLALTGHGGVLASHALAAPTQRSVSTLALAAIDDAKAANGRLAQLDVSALAIAASGPWPESTRGAAILTVRAEPKGQAQAYVVVGLSPRLPFDAAYEEHLHTLQRHLQNAAARISSVQAMLAAERAREDLLLQAPMAAALLVGPDWRYDLANALYEQMVGRRVVGHNWHDCFPELRGGPVDEILASVYRDGKTVVTTEQLIPLAGARNSALEERFFDFTMIPVRAEDGAIYGMMVVAVETTEQVRDRRALERAVIEREGLVSDLRRLARTKDEFLAMLGHELRNPLAPIVTALRLMEMHGSKELTHEREVIGRQVQHLTRLVDDLLDVARIASGKIELSTRVMELSDAVRRAVEVSEPLFVQKEQRLTLQVPARGLPVEADAARMTQVIANLLTNASKYSEAGTEVVVSAERSGGSVLLHVADSGIGIDATVLPSVFDLFSQAPQSVDRSHGGLGLGLAIVRNIMLLHGGKVSVQSAGGGLGSTFTIELPLADRALGEPTPIPHLPAATPVARRRVLIVDDNEDAAELLARMLSATGHLTQTAADGPGALEALEDFNPDVALLDIGLPVMDGYELARLIRAHPAGERTVLFALTGYGQEADRKKALQAGFDRHFVKPVDPQAVAQAITGAARLEA